MTALRKELGYDEVIARLDQLQAAIAAIKAKGGWV